MASLLEIKKKIGGVKNTRKITKAMQMVATAKMKLFQRKANSTGDFVWDLLKILNDILDGEFVNKYTEQRSKGKTLFVLYTSDKGLCGALNNNLIKSLFNSNKWNDLEENQKLLITVGKKSREFVRNNGYKAEESFVGLPENLDTHDILPVIDKILSYWHDGTCKEVIFVAPHFKNTFTFYPVLKTFLPFSQKMVQTNIGHGGDKFEISKSNNGFMIYEPTRERVQDVLFLQVIQGLFVQSFFDLKASEYSSRMIAMKNATDSANDMIYELTKVYNKTRQQVITQQIAELIGASEAMNS